VYDYTGLYIVCAMLVSCRLHELFPGLVHVEDKTMIYPTYSEMDMMFGNKTYNWSKQYSSHVWRRLEGGKVPGSPSNITHLNSTIGQMMRYIYNGPR